MARYRDDHIFDLRVSLIYERLDVENHCFPVANFVADNGVGWQLANADRRHRIAVLTVIKLDQFD